MRRSNFKLPSKSIIALILAAVSFLMLLLPWVNLSIEILGRNYSIPDLLDLVCKYEGMTSMQFELEMQAGIAELAAELADDTGVVLKAKDATKNIEKVLDGSLSLLDAATITSYAGGVLKDIDQAMNLNLTGLSSSDRVALMMISEISSTLSTVSIVLWAVIAALVITFIFAVATLPSFRKSGAIAYAVAVAVPVVATIIGVGTLNDTVQSYASYVTDLLDELLWMMGTSSYGVQSLEIFHLSAAPFLALICAVVAVVIMCAGTIRLPGIKTPTVPNFKWTCSCGAQNSMGNTFCPSCGQKKPEKPRCACGAVIAPSSKFCGKCGKAVEFVESSNIVPTPPPARCPHCGSIMDGGICRRCNPPVPQFTHCIRCGAPVYDGATLCTTCRTPKNSATPGPFQPMEDVLE